VCVCGHTNPPDAIFCGECGVSLIPQPLNCATCGQVNPADLKFCRGCGARQSISTAQTSRGLLAAVAPPTCIAGRYHVQQLLGEGAKKRVYLAHDALLNRAVALALFKAEGLDDDGRVRIQREIRALSQLGNHPHIVTLYDAGEEQNRPYFVSHYLPGGSIQDLLRTAEHNRLSLNHALRLADQICQALAYAHEHGIIHRDLKPSNVWLTQDGTIKLGDFGLATSLDHSHFSLVGVLMGTAAYLPPEQLQGHKLDARSDLYALGAMLYEMVAGRPPFVGDGLVSLIGQHLNAQPVAPSVHNPLIPPALDSLILQLLEKSPDRRPESATVVRSLFHPIAVASLSTAEHPSQPSSHALDRLASEVFVGREQEMDMLREQLEATFAGHGRTVILTGEPGIGKTRTAMEFATYARLRGARVLIGRCHDEKGMPPYWLWVHLMRTHISERPFATLRAELGSGAAAIAQVITEVQNRFPDLPTLPREDPTHVRFHFFDSFTQFVKNTAKNQPLVFVLDDLQWADTPSLLLLQFLVREIADVPLLVVVTCRDTTPVSHSPLTDALAALTRAPGSKTLLLQGLSHSEVARFIEITTGNPPGEEITTAVYHGTEGHPFFLTEVIRLLATEGNPSLLPNTVPTAFDLPLPQGVRSAIEGRLAQVSEACRQLLTTAAVIGREFHLKVLEELWPSSSPSLLDLLNEAIVARLIAPVASFAGQYNFSHALIRETIYESLPLSRYLDLHQQIGEVLERIYSNAVEEHLAELAHHFLVAARCGGPVTKGVDYARRAGDYALTLLAYEEAVVQYERALQALSLQPPQGQTRGELLFALGEAQRRTGDTPKAQETFLAAATIAKRRKTVNQKQAAALLARAALGYGATLFTPTQRDSTLIGLCEDALDLLGEEAAVLRARIMAQLAMGLYYSDPARGRTLSEAAVQIALQVNEARTLAVALGARRYAISFPENLEERLAVTTEMVALGQQRGYREVEVLGHQWRTVDVLEQGDRYAVDREIAAHAQLAEEMQQPLHRWYNLVFRAMCALRQGQLVEGERLAHEALLSGERVQSQTPFIFFGIQLYQLRTFQGRFQELEDAVKSLIQQHPNLIVWQCALAYLYCETNRREEAYRVFAPLAADDFASLPHDLNWGIAVALLAETCSVLSDTRAAAVLYDQLLPYAERHIIVGPAIASYGSASYYLGLLATTLERWQEAEMHFTHALAANLQMAAWPWIVYAETANARMLLTRNHSGDQEKAGALLARALTTTQELGLAGLEEKIKRLLAVASSQYPAVSRNMEESEVLPVAVSSASLHPIPNPQYPTPSLFRCEGEYWTITYQDIVCRFKDVSGLRYIAHLLQHPNQEFHVTDLVQVEAREELPIGANDVEFIRQGSTSAGLGDAGEVLDVQARTAYKQRIRDLHEELEEAREFNDIGRIEKLEDEIEFVTQELAGAIGLGGRNRKAASASERARVNVTRAIKSVIKKTAEQNESLGLYWATTIKTGNFCSYLPDPRFPVSWQF
jgi:tRNA A-37 threonylcarbamoyl transferase component Bud32/tetratricopeptide (TPR) repeat protein